MLEPTSSPISPIPSIGARTEALDQEVEELHRRCGIYTKPEVIRWILDAVGWRGEADLSPLRLLEPAAGDGAFVVEAARRLVASYQRYGIELKARALSHRIRAYELHPDEARQARSRVISTLRELGVHHRTANACARSWIINADFLLADLPQDGFTHAVGNPPYIRWSKVPPNLRANYDSRLPRDMIGGDLFLPFLDRTLNNLEPMGRCGFLCSDRWRFMGFAEAFRKKWLPRLDITLEHLLSAREAFVEYVDSYPSVLIASTRPDPRSARPRRTMRTNRTLAEQGYVVKVGPALGHTPAFVLEPDEHDVEPELLQPWVDGSEIREGMIIPRGRRIITMHREDGTLVEPIQFPGLMARLERFFDQLRLRAIVRRGSPWFRPIDRVCAPDWRRPKLLVPELAKVPRLAIDRSGAIPSHGVYAIFAPDDDIEHLYQKLGNGNLARVLAGIAPKVKGEYVRCYKRFLTMIRVAD